MKYTTQQNKYTVDKLNPIHFVKRCLINNEVRRIVSSRTDVKIADLGCGLGIISRELANFAKVDAYDIDARAVKFAREKYHQSINLNLYDDNILNIKKNNYDLVICSEVLEYIADDLAVLNKINKMLKPNGYFILTVPFNKSLITEFDKREKSRRYPLRQISNKVEKANFTIRKVRYWGYPLLKLFYLNVYVPKSNREAIKKINKYQFSKITLWLLKYIRYIFLIDLLFNSKKSFGLLLIGQKK
ncbi:MAG: class I SAM-dependent methyltransferase [Patescibacteria group bacterium]|nr:class I SAM-dependent methyltransferase [Patescibacteria group bacterium]